MEARDRSSQLRWLAPPSDTWPLRLPSSCAPAVPPRWPLLPGLRRLCPPRRLGNRGLDARGGRGLPGAEQVPAPDPAPNACPAASQQGGHCYPIAHMSTPLLRDMKELAQGHTARPGSSREAELSIQGTNRRKHSPSGCAGTGRAPEGKGDTQGVKAVSSPLSEWPSQFRYLGVITVPV